LSGMSASDRYAALAELDTIFSTSTSTTAPTIDWSGSSPTPVTSSAPPPMPSAGLPANPFSSASGSSNAFFGTSPPGSSFVGQPPVPSFPAQPPMGVAPGPSSTNPFFGSGGPQPPTTSTMFSGASSSGNLWGKASSPSFGSSFMTDQQQSFKAASNPQANASSTQFNASFTSSFASSHPQQQQHQQQQQPRPFHPSAASSAAPVPFGVAAAPPVNNLFGSTSTFDASSVSAFGNAPQHHQQQQQQHQHYQQNLFASSSLHSAPRASLGAANPFLNGGGGGAGGGIFSPATSGAGGNFPFAPNGQQQSLPTAGPPVAPGMGGMAGNPFL